LPNLALPFDDFDRHNKLSRRTSNVTNKRQNSYIKSLDQERNDFIYAFSPVSFLSSKSDALDSWNPITDKDWMSLAVSAATVPMDSFLSEHHCPFWCGWKG